MPVISENCLIKIENFDGSARGISKKEFSIDGPFIDIISPLEASVLVGREKSNIVWESRNLGNELINIYYSTDEGYEWILVSDKMVDTGLYIWDVPHLDDIYHNCIIKVETNSDKAIQISEKFTIINQTNKIRIETPNGGELIEAGSRYKMKWMSNSLKADLFKVFFSSNQGRTWERIESRISNSNEYLWKVPMIESED